MIYECDCCGLAVCDLPDGVNPALVFDKADDGRVLCLGCQGGGTVIF